MINNYALLFCIIGNPIIKKWGKMPKRDTTLAYIFPDCGIETIIQTYF